MSNLVELAPIPKPDDSAQTTAQKALATVNEFTVATAEDYERLGTYLKAIKSRWTEIDEARKKLKAPIDAAAKAVQEFFRPPLQTLEQAEAVAKRKLVAYADEQERIRRDEQRRADEAARKERERIEAQAREAERKAREKAEADRRAAEEAAAAGRAEEAAKLAARAAATEERAAARVDSLQERAAAVVAPVVARETPKVKGITTSTVWDFEIVDPSKLPAAFLMPDEQKIRKTVTALKGDAASVFGDAVRVFERTQLGSRTA